MPSPRENPALTVFLCTVAGLLVWGIYTRPATLGPLATAVQLCDGDLDGNQRRAELETLLRQAQAAGDAATLWLGRQAAVGLAEHGAYRALSERIGRTPVPSEVAEWLGLGDSILVNVGLALRAESEDQPDLAAQRWRQVATQCRLAQQPLAAELAAAALQGPR